ncbi:GNAT family N-acetyltransferase [Salinadaptatus halalkaliphilus]|uniref:GNAT family N-acetyltransferase n=1 Tax=Salinadaptatus halalkaliphilus TaxID=2419781 RepID=UPI001FEBEAF7|nr:GNAT family N-acetyltransferase [Salinadaptatus halalkaliphilus]
MYVLCPRDGEDGAGEIAGTTSVEIDWEKRTLQPGIWFRKRFWGRRYAGERAAAVFTLAFDRLDLEVVTHHRPRR